MFYSSLYQSPLGTLTLASEGKNLVGLWVEGQKYFGDSIQGSVTPKEDLPIFNTTKNWLDDYFAGKQPPLSQVPLSPFGGAFRQLVWSILCEIPYGSLTSYGKIANEVAQRKGIKQSSAQAVGGAVGHNPISIIIPCHRVVGADGSLTGYASGISNKIKLLKHEGVDRAGLYIPSKGTAL